ncbi:ornithine carbamoyltransferase [Alphaproteobacteria bacterium]|nr:ornithine carbamoyltransferase [Alphaproteobacteria bacterium]
MNNFLEIKDYNFDQLNKIIEDAKSRKKLRLGFDSGVKDLDSPMKGKVLALLFQKPSTRTRVSFDIAMRQLGGETLVLNSEDMQIDRGETFADTARVLSKYVDIIMIRSTTHEVLTEVSNYSTVPVINGLTDRSHPCQVLSDIFTYIELRDSIKGKNFVWFGDSNNVARSWVEASVIFGFNFTLASPKEFSLDAELVKWANQNGGNVSLVYDPLDAVLEADCIITDVWVSMGDEINQSISSVERRKILSPYRVTSKLMNLARSDSLFMHCLPAHRGEEVDSEVIDGPKSVVWLEAENRLHIQKSIILNCFSIE